jgi:polyferredoxin
MSKAIPSSLDSGGMYLSEGKIHPREVDGRFQRLRTAAVFWLLGMYYLFPWLSWDGRQAVLFDLPARKFYVFGLAFWPQDFVFLALLLIIAGLTLFFVTALAGRLWCGYACPQTVWTEVFLWMERWTEGPRHKRIRLDASPWTREKLARKSAKHSLWIVFALWTGFTFVGFFTPIRDLGGRAWPFDWSGWETFWVLFYSLATWGNAGFLREQVCKYMCPYARFQSAMFDRNTLIIAYDLRRGEPRGSRKRGSLASVLERDRPPLSVAAAQQYLIAAAANPSAADAAVGAHATTGLIDFGGARAALAPVSPDQLGDCIDCTLCVQVCPTGIDIRNGLQYECIACGACIDACNDVMTRIGYPRGLIQHTTQNAVDGLPSRVLRPRVLLYGLLLALIVGGWAWGVSQRAPLIVDAIRDRNALYRISADGEVENAYTLRLINKQDRVHRYRIGVQGHPDIRLLHAPVEIEAEAEAVLSLALTLRAPPGSVQGRQDVAFVVESLTDPTIRQTQPTRFFGPTP